MPTNYNISIDKLDVIGVEKAVNAVKILVDATSEFTTTTENISSETIKCVTSGVTRQFKVDLSKLSSTAHDAAIKAAKAFSKREEERIQQKNPGMGSMPPPSPLTAQRSFPSLSTESTRTNNVSRSQSGSHSGPSGSLPLPKWNIKSLSPEAIAAAASVAAKRMGMGTRNTPPGQTRESKTSTSISTGSAPRLSNSGILLGPNDRKELDPNKPDEGWMAVNLCFAKFSSDKKPLMLSSEIIASLDEDLVDDLAALQLATAHPQPLQPLITASPKKRLRDNEVS